MLKFFTTVKDGNLAYHVTNQIDLVNKSRKELADKYNFDINKLHFMNQVHSNIVKTISKKSNIQTCDALITNKKNTPLLVLVADCIPILFYDTVTQAIGVAHAGRAGTFENISAKTVENMILKYNCDVKNIQVALGPSIQKCCYEVSTEIAQEVTSNFGDEFVQKRNIDLQSLNKKQLLKIGILEKNIQISDICTKCSNQPYFSYRKDRSCGRFAGLIMLR